MVDRIVRNEERLDKSIASIKELERALEKFKLNKRNIDLVNRYYGSKDWFKDKEAYESGNIGNIKAGVLSEDSVWNMDEDIRNLIEDMKLIIQSYTN